MSSAGNSSSAAPTDARDYFFALTEAMRDMLRAGELFTCALRGEDSTFVRLNKARIGQAGQVKQQQIEIDLIAGQKHAAGTLNLSGDSAADRSRVATLLDRLRSARELGADDPYLSFNKDVAASSESVGADELPSADEVLDTIDSRAGSADLVGIYASGGMQSGFASSLGQRNWHSSQTFNFDWSVFEGDQAAVKSTYAGMDWTAGELGRRLEQSIDDLRVLRQPRRKLSPGRFRVYLAPAAMDEVFSILSWGGFGLRARMTKASPFLRMYDQGARLAPAFTLTENIANGAAPGFQSAGFLRPDEVPLIDQGAVADQLVSPRSAVEFGRETNGAEPAEAPQALDLAPGELDADSIAETLHTGLIVSNLWYLNFSDRAACRTTGMTRYATLWVENGRVCGPVEPMRFDDSIYRVFGSHLVGLTKQRDWILDPGTYEWRSTRSARLPGALIDDFTLTL